MNLLRNIRGGQNFVTKGHVGGGGGGQKRANLRYVINEWPLRAFLLNPFRKYDPLVATRLNKFTKTTSHLYHSFGNHQN